MLSTLFSSLYFTSRVIMMRRDLATVIAIILSILSVQLALWIMARHSADIEWWRATALGCVAAVVSPFAMAMFSKGIQMGAGSVIIALFAIWLIAGFLYDLEIWQKILLTLLCPVIGLGAYFLALLIRNAIFGY